MRRLALPALLLATTSLAMAQAQPSRTTPVQDLPGKPPPLGAAPGPQTALPPGGKPRAMPPPGPAPGGGAYPMVPRQQPPASPPPSLAGKPPPADAAPGQPAAPRAPGVPGGGGGLRQASSGTGFVIGRGRILTNHHVVDGCVEMRARTAAGTELVATVAAVDRNRDLALLNAQGDPGPPLRFRSGPDIRRGDNVVTYGFPLAGLLSSGPTLTTGDVSALAGLRDNPVQFQISAPVQPGNSGGPLLDLGGNVVGVVVSKLNAQRIAQSTGDIPQNVNFAVQGREAIAFLQENGAAPELVRTEGPPRSAAEVGEIAHPSTVFLRCLR